jgi:hypothetical protein
MGSADYGLVKDTVVPQRPLSRSWLQQYSHGPFQKRICEKRCSMRSMTRITVPEMFVELMPQKFTGYELYGEFTVNYVQPTERPAWKIESTGSRTFRRQVLRNTGGADRNWIEGIAAVSAEVEWTFPLEFVEVV